jgi:hypothetical protein
MTHPKFNRKKLIIRNLAERKDNLSVEKDFIHPLSKPVNLTKGGKMLIAKTAGKIRAARDKNRSVILAFGAHSIKNGLAHVMIDLVKKGWITHLATNGAGIIHDWEFAYRGKSGENVRENVMNGQFGIWNETGYYINLALVSGAYEGLGYGESVGKMIFSEGIEIPGYSELIDEAKRKISKDSDKAAAAIDFAGVIRTNNLKPGFMNIPHPFKSFSVQSSAFELNIPFTGHPMVGHDIIYNHPLNNGAAIGRAALTDFLYYTESVRNLEHGVYISLGSAIMSPMIFEKSLSMAQNIELQKGKHIDNHFIIVVDLAKNDWDWIKDGEPPADNPSYYLRYCKTFYRMGGEMHYLTADNRDFLLELNHRLS